MNISSLLTQIFESYNFLKDMKDKPSDLDTIQVQLGKNSGANQSFMQQN